MPLARLTLQLPSGLNSRTQGVDLGRSWDAFVLMFTTGAAALLATVTLVLARGLLGPTVFDRVLAGNTIGTLAVGLMSVYGFLSGRPAFLDIAIVYALLNILSTLAILKFFRFGSLGDPERIEPPRTEIH